MTGFPPAFIRIPDHMLETFARAAEAGLHPQFALLLERGDGSGIVPVTPEPAPVDDTPVDDTPVASIEVAQLRRDVARLRSTVEMLVSPSQVGDADASGMSGRVRLARAELSRGSRP